MKIIFNNKWKIVLAILLIIATVLFWNLYTDLQDTKTELSNTKTELAATKKTLQVCQKSQVDITQNYIDFVGLINRTFENIFVEDPFLDAQGEQLNQSLTESINQAEICDFSFKSKVDSDKLQL